MVRSGESLKKRWTGLEEYVHFQCVNNKENSFQRGDQTSNGMNTEQWHEHMRWGFSDNQLEVDLGL